MLRRTSVSSIWKFDARRRRRWHAEHKYRELTKYQREAMGLTDWQHSQSHLVQPSTKFRFNPNFVGLTKGVTADEAMKWTFEDQLKLPQVAPEGYKPPQPAGRRAWPSVWTEEFAEGILALSDAELREFVLESLTTVIFEEAQRDGIELRRLDIEGNPLTELPPPEVVRHYNLEDAILRDRVLQRVVEEGFGFAPSSKQREDLRSVDNIIDYVVARVTVCRVEKEVVVTDAVLDFLAAEPVQPTFGYQHVLPQDTREELVKAWEAEFHWPWQFGNAVYNPRDREEDQLTPAFMQAESVIRAHEAFEKEKESGELRRRHLEKIAAAAAASS